MNLFKFEMRETSINEYLLSRCMYAECPCVELSRVVILAGRPVEGDSKLDDQKSNFITERVHLDGQGCLQV
jgi:hypothetical protein